MKPYQKIPIVECGEPLVAIPCNHFAVEHPHPYVKAGAPYGDKSPYYLRQTVVERLLQAQAALQDRCPRWRIQIFDAYRPLAVQQYMVNYSFAQVVADQGLRLDELTEAQRERCWQQVYQFWAVPSSDPTTPPPHSTGAAIDVTLVDAIGAVVDMGSPIDEMTPRSYPNYFADQVGGSRFHQHRQLLRHSMEFAGFRQHPREWWHFSWGDQLWAWLSNQEPINSHEPLSHLTPIARYGAI
ncbi:M15 family metallopeptidase [Thermocoleostomius sinensis]|uniref:D-alanyl-D-alanine dipeptidase n=1 Tax=Thermocoleostomius sinensis A174 TaxID=2016057 RepID=A0A9E9C872_9CYAN|nr:M15 family metallopeptidase [Thermocoleostomius sinensis]WAL61114.1 D-alanyl-D-alanine dipeptidase [Thermocoleostomius sinensis A174]